MRKSHGTGAPPWSFKSYGEGTCIEEQVLIFHPENITIGRNVYVGHQTILKGYFNNIMTIGDGTWIGQQCFLHSAGGIFIGSDVGVGPGVRIITSSHDLASQPGNPIMNRPLTFGEVRIGDGADIGVGSIILPGVSLGNRVQVGAGSVVTKSFPDASIVAGVPARLLRIHE